MDRGAINLQWCAAFLGACTDAGVRHLVVSPGSRSTPLVLAAQSIDSLRLHVQPDERAAAFFALGLSMSGQSPAAVLATSGSAVANWFPAVVEAGHSAIPLLLISADRPPELHHAGANQTIDQRDLFGRHVRERLSISVESADDAGLRYARDIAARALERSRWPWPGPLHVNIALREPLVPERWPDPALAKQAGVVNTDVRRGRVLADDDQLAAVAERVSAGRGCIVCGPDTPADAVDAVAALASACDAPILADVLSGLRFGRHDRSHVIAGYDSFLRSPDFVAAHDCDWVLQFGTLPISGSLQDFLDRQRGRIWITPHGDWPDPQHTGGVVVRADAAGAASALLGRIESADRSRWFADFQEADAIVRRLLATDERPFEAAILDIVQNRSPEDCPLFVGNSMVARDADGFMTGRDNPLRIHGNRGASGIDGNVSTALGMAMGASVHSVALLGDVATFHDMNGLLMARDLSITLIVFANAGGQIFRYLPQSHLEKFEDLWVCDPGLDLARVAALFDLDFGRAATAAEFAAEFDNSLGRRGTTLIEARIDAAASAAGHRQFWSDVDRGVGEIDGKVSSC